ncbi:MAG: DUF5058 family protein [Pyramidobacter sp.]|nr:DUF5058 family protein [Pyramidobacter sp.]
MEYMKIANSSLLWMACIPGVALCIFQAWLFFARALRDAKQLGVTGEQVRKAAFSSALTSIGPAVVIVAGMVTLLVSLGGPTAWMRLAYIGAVNTEMTNASLVASTAGIKLGEGDMPINVFTTIVLCMGACACGWTLFTGLFAHKLGDMQQKLSGGSFNVMKIMSGASSMGLFGYMAFDRGLPYGNNTWAAVGGFVAMLVLGFGNKKWKLKWLSSWTLPLTMLFGMACAVVARAIGA